MFPNVNPKQLEQAMKKLGVKQEDLQAREVLITCADKTLIVRDPNVVKINMMGQISLQITGTIEEVSSISEEDIETVATQANVSKDEARKALEQAHGDLAEAILTLQQ